MLEKRATNGRPYGLFQNLPHNRTADFEKENKYIKKVRIFPNLFLYIYANGNSTFALNKSPSIDNSSSPF